MAEVRPCKQEEFVWIGLFGGIRQQEGQLVRFYRFLMQLVELGCRSGGMLFLRLWRDILK